MRDASRRLLDIVDGNGIEQKIYLPYPILRDQIRRCFPKRRLRDKRAGWTRCQASIALDCFDQLWQDLLFFI
jgi:hypothetical protein